MHRCTLPTSCTSRQCQLSDFPSVQAGHCRPGGAETETVCRERGVHLKPGLCDYNSVTTESLHSHWAFKVLLWGNASHCNSLSSHIGVTSVFVLWDIKSGYLVLICPKKQQNPKRHSVTPNHSPSQPRHDAFSQHVVRFFFEVHVRLQRSVSTGLCVDRVVMTEKQKLDSIVVQRLQFANPARCSAPHISLNTAI